MALLKLLQIAVRTELDSLWIGRDLGYRGGRRTGLALTDDIHVDAHARRWGVTVDRATKGNILSERTAAIVWRVLSQVECTVFLWNVFPLHPHQAGKPFTNRSHNAMEREVGEELLALLIGMLKPRRLVAIGADAAASLERVLGSNAAVRVRHPSYGGQVLFADAIRTLYEHSGEIRGST